MTLAFVDTSAWIALVMPDDPDHQRARTLYRDQSRRIRFTTSNLVLAETYTWLRYRNPHAVVVQFHRTVASAIQTGGLELAWVTPDVHERAWDIFGRYDDQVFSFCDCTSFVLAGDEAVDFVFGFDSDFATMGFDLRPSLA